jgi:type 1 glutamine amidotransferase
MSIPIPALVLTGQSSQYHDWTVSSAALAKRLRETGLFDVLVATAADAPPLDRIGVIVMDYEGERWPSAFEQALDARIAGGGGLVIYHAADNAFPAWPAFQEMCGIGGWAGRDESAGPKVRWRDGHQVLDNSLGVAMHPPRHDFSVVVRAPDHPIVRGLPASWLHADDELYSQLRGPAKHLEVLATATADPAVYAKATGEHEPVLMTIGYGAGRVFHTTLGHVGPADGSKTTAIDCVGFIVTLQRGAEWAATGGVTQPVPADFPSATRTSLRAG